ncbi:MAG: type II toxin-antitoxin system VapC family toxin [Thermomicrobiales bacterium]|nr:type II toxin-antitoxin system VapC family toxin [Thermomicrobiales bacterium]
MVIDASVWLRFLNSGEEHHSATSAWIEKVGFAGRSFAVPAIFLAEIAGAVARSGTPDDVLDLVVAEIAQSGFIEVYPVDSSLIVDSVAIIKSTRLKGADAIYAALALRLHLPLVSWDKEHLSRASSVVDVMTPVQALERFPLQTS